MDVETFDETATIKLELLDNAEILDDLCRVCAKTSSFMIPIFKQDLHVNLYEKISQHLPICITKNDTLPLQVCDNCVTTIIAFHDLLEGCAEAQKKLLQIQENDNSKQLEDDSDLELNECKDFIISDNEEDVEESSTPSSPSTPPSIKKKSTRQTPVNLLCHKSKDKYYSVYTQYVNWQKCQKIKPFSEKILLVYFGELAKTKKPPTLWGYYSMLKSTINLYQNIDINTYKHLKSFLKKNSSGFEKKRSENFTSDDIVKFLTEAPNQRYLLDKVILIFGIGGACNIFELCHLNVDHLEDNATNLQVSIKARETSSLRKFIIDNDFYAIVKKYMALRPESATSDRFFLSYNDNQCKKQSVGKNKIGIVPRIIASYLNLANADKYTGHCFRRTSAVLLKTNTVTVEDVQGFVSNKDYIQGSICNTTKILTRNSTTLKISETNRNSDFTTKRS